MPDLSLAALLRWAVFFALSAIAAYAAGIAFFVQRDAIAAGLGLSNAELLLVASAGLSLLPRIAGDFERSTSPDWKSRLIVWMVLVAAYVFFLTSRGLIGVADFAASLVFWANLIKATERTLPLATITAELKVRNLRPHRKSPSASGAFSS